MPGHLPFMKTMDDAVRFFLERNDNFYLTAFMIEAWVGQLVMATVAEYAEKNNPRDRLLQAGRAERLFQDTFGGASDPEFPHVFQSLLRFCAHDGALPEMLRKAMLATSFEHEYEGGFIDIRSAPPASAPLPGVPLMRRTALRWCDWLEALVHCQTHAQWHGAPELFDPDPDRRELAVLGLNQRFYAHLDDFSKRWWDWHHACASQEFKDSPKWPALGRAMAADKTRAWNYEEPDAAILSFWPLVLRHNWTYQDLLGVLREVLTHPRAYPCREAQELAAYCRNVLGLHKGATGAKQGKTSAPGSLPGRAVALRLFPPATR